MVMQFVPPPMPPLGLKLSFLQGVTSRAQTIAVPSGVVAGDLLVLHDLAVRVNTPPDSVFPSGFTAVITQGGTAQYTNRSNISFKVATATDAGSLLTGMNGTYQAAANQKVLLVFRGNKPLVSAIASAVNSQATNDTPSSQVVQSALTPNIVFASFIVGADTGAFAGRGFTPDKDGEVSSNTANSYFSYKIFNDSPSPVTLTLADGGNSNILQSFSLRCQ